MIRIPNAYTFTSKEKNLLMKSLLLSVRSMEDELGHIDHLTDAQKKEYQMYIDIYRGL